MPDDFFDLSIDKVFKNFTWKQMTLILFLTVSGGFRIIRDVEFLKIPRSL